MEMENEPHAYEFNKYTWKNTIEVYNLNKLNFEIPYFNHIKLYSNC